MAKRDKRAAQAQVALAWRTANFTRAAKLPPLARFIGDTERAARSSGEIVAALKAKFGGAANG